MRDNPRCGGGDACVLGTACAEQPLVAHSRPGILVGGAGPGARRSHAPRGLQSMCPAAVATRSAAGAGHPFVRWTMCACGPKFGTERRFLYSGPQRLADAVGSPSTKWCGAEGEGQCGQQTRISQDQQTRHRGSTPGLHEGQCNGSIPSPPTESQSYRLCQLYIKACSISQRTVN